MRGSRSSLVDDVLSLPADQRLLLVNRLLESLNVPTQPEVEALWAKEAERRVAQVKSGQVKPLPGEQVFAAARKRLRR
jgi:putative addiction module component (TIGR02574 family)